MAGSCLAELILPPQKGVLKPHDPSAAHRSDPFPSPTPRTMTLRRDCCRVTAFLWWVQRCLLERNPSHPFFFPECSGQGQVQGPLNRPRRSYSQLRTNTDSIRLQNLVLCSLGAVLQNHSPPCPSCALETKPEFWLCWLFQALCSHHNGRQGTQCQLSEG